MLLKIIRGICGEMTICHRANKHGFVVLVRFLMNEQLRGLKVGMITAGKGTTERFDTRV